MTEQTRQEDEQTTFNSLKSNKKQVPCVIISNLPDNAKELTSEMFALMSTLAIQLKSVEFKYENCSHIKVMFAECLFLDEVDLSDAIAKIHGLVWNDHHLIAQSKEDYLYQRHHYSENAVLIRSLPYNFSEEDVWRLFSNLKLGFIKIFRDALHHVSECIVNFNDEEAVAEALMWNGAHYVEGPIHIQKINSDTLVSVPVPLSSPVDIDSILEEAKTRECFIHACVQKNDKTNERSIFLFCSNQELCSNLLRGRECLELCGRSFPVRTADKTSYIYVLDVPKDATKSDFVTPFGEDAAVELSFIPGITRLAFKNKALAEQAFQRSAYSEVQGKKVKVCGTLNEAFSLIAATKQTPILTKRTTNQTKSAAEIIDEFYRLLHKGKKNKTRKEKKKM